MSLRIHALFHNDMNHLGSIFHWIERNNHTLTQTRLYKDDEFPDIDDFDWLIIMGGPMGVYDTDKLPWLIAEKTFIKQACDAGKTIIGMCLGSQLIAEVLGAKVGPIEVKEIGWTKLTLTEQVLNHPLVAGLPTEFTTFEWHGDGFECPKGAIPLATSEHWPNQGFIYQTEKHKQLNTWILACQSHFEVNLNTISNYIYKGKGISQQDLEAHPNSIQPAEVIFANEPHFADANNAYFDKILDNLAKLTVSQ